VEELVGELQDEHDRSRTSLIRQGDEIIVDAALRPDELQERTGVKVPDDREYETLAGFVADVLDRIPEVGDEVTIEQGILRVEHLDGTRVDRLRYVPDPPEPETEPSAAEETEHDRIVDRIRGGLGHE
jgi:CBS domain containing-hemolysin-like protein